MRKVETDFMFEDKGVAMIYPELWDRFVSHLKPEARSDPRDAYLRLMTADDPAVSLPAAKLWNTLEMSVSRVEPAAEDVDKVENDAWGIAHARLEAHYFVNGGFMQDGDLLKEENVEKIRHIPCKSLARHDVCWREVFDTDGQQAASCRAVLTWCVRRGRLGSCTSFCRNQSCT